MSNPYTVIELNGRTYTTATLPGAQAGRLYRRLWAMISAADVGTIPLALAGRREAIMVRIAMVDGFEQLVDEVLKDAVVKEPGLPDRHLPRDQDAVFMGRPSESTTAALYLMEAQGFFVVPGTPITSAPKPGASPAPTVTPAQVPDAV